MEVAMNSIGDLIHDNEADRRLSSILKKDTILEE